MSLATQAARSGSQAGNTPQPYGGGEHGGTEHSVSGVPSPAPETHGTGATAGVTSKTSLASGQNQGRQPQSPSPSQGQTQNQNGQPGGGKEASGKVQPAEEEGGAARGEGTKLTDGGNEQSSNTEPDSEYPEQKHAGKLPGPGPEYGKIHKVTLTDRFQGLKEEIKGSVKHDPELKKTGKERMTGELKRKQLEKEQNLDPFGTADDDSKKEDDQGSNATKNGPEKKTDEPGLTEQPQAHPTEKGREEQAATVQPEGNGTPDTPQQVKENATTGRVP